ncbi:hypothetical protein GQ53DRAFT_767414 [Thozetella sp. PMI_491]|nr:hypothetical protein GQ53DRAFT_767414 [Thozetella sp. PMI_491]
MVLRASTTSMRSLAAFRAVRPPSMSARRWNSASSQPSPTNNFYKTFARPVVKCLLIAVLTYQMLYLGWVKLEAEEVKAERKAEISELEAQVHTLQQNAEKKR